VDVVRDSEAVFYVSNQRFLPIFLK
jgi:hypothetical protein